MPLIEGKSASLRDYIVTGWHNLANVRTLEYSYVCNYATGKDETLFDARADPAETANLAADQPEIVKEYRERLAAFLGKLPAELPGCRWMTQPPIRIWAEKSPAGKVVSEYRN